MENRSPRPGDFGRQPDQSTETLVGVEYSRYLIPKPTSTVIGSETIASLIAALASERWLPKRDSPSLKSVQHRMPAPDAKAIRVPSTSFPRTLISWIKAQPETEYISQFAKLTQSPDAVDANFVRERRDNGGLYLQYSFRNLHHDNIRFPLTEPDFVTPDLYYDLNFYLSNDLVYVTSETLDGFDSTKCSCGAELTFDRIGSVFIDQLLHDRCPDCHKQFMPAQNRFRIAHPMTGEPSYVMGGAVFRFAIELDCGKCIPKTHFEFHPAFRDLCMRELQCEFIEMETVR